MSARGLTLSGHVYRQLRQSPKLPSIDLAKVPPVPDAHLLTDEDIHSSQVASATKVPAKSLAPNAFDESKDMFSPAHLTEIENLILLNMDDLKLTFCDSGEEKEKKTFDLKGMSSDIPAVQRLEKLKSYLKTLNSLLVSFQLHFTVESAKNLDLYKRILARINQVEEDIHRQRIKANAAQKKGPPLFAALDEIAGSSVLSTFGVVPQKQSEPTINQTQTVELRI